MLVDPPIEQLNEKTACAYELAVLVAQRACQLVDGAQPMIPDSAANAVSLACKEIAAGKVQVVPGDHKKEMFVPLTKEEREARAAAKRAREEQESYRKYSASVDEVNREAAEEDKAEDTEATIEFETITDETDAVTESSDDEE